MVRLHVGEEPTGPEEVGGVEDPRRLLVPGEEPRRAGGEPQRIVLGEDRRLVGGDLVAPDLGEVILIARVLLEVDPPT
jgi:hypothetical protein